MEVQIRNNDFSGKKIYTLAQSRTDKNVLPPVIIAGNGSNPNNRYVLKAKAKKKMITQKLMLGLIDIGKQKMDEDLVKSFWNTYHCQDNIITHKKRTYGKYCKNRYCIICLGIRKAKLINNYLPVISKWDDPKFVTITIRSVPAKRLPIIMKAMNRAFRKIKERNRKRFSRGKGVKLIGIKSLECNFNPKRRTYNPHFHVIVPNMTIAKQLVTDWLIIWTIKHNKSLGQDIKDVNNVEGSLIEIIKYSTKVFTDPDPNNKKEKNASPKVYMKAMYNIITAMKGERIFDRFGLNMQKKDNESKGLVREVTEYDSWVYDPENADWFSEQTGQVFAHYTPDIELQNMLANNIDMEVQ